jgi:hypothetical protein
LGRGISTITERLETVKVESLPQLIGCSGITYEITASKSNEYTHDIYKFPTKFIPEIPRWALRTLSKRNGAAIMDPFCGSGTTLVEASLLGKFSVGIDINPFCRLLSKVKTTPFNSKKFDESERLFNKIMSSLKDERNIHHRNKLDLPELYNLEHWFSKAAINELAVIRDLISHSQGVTSDDVVDFFKICLASILKRVSFADKQSPKPYVSKRIIKKPPAVTKEFSRSYRNSIESLKRFSAAVHNRYSHIVPCGNAKELILGKTFLDQEGIEGYDLMVTSPPYINAYDLVRTFKLELFWLDLIHSQEVRGLKEKHIGTEEIPQILYSKGSPTSGHEGLDDIIEKIYRVDEKRAYVVWKFFDDMKQNLQQVFDLLLPGGCYVIVVGNSKIRNNEIQTSRILSDIGCKIGFQEIERLSYIIKNHYLRIPRGVRGGKIKVDHIGVLQKP